MATKPKPLSESKRPRLRAGRMIRAFVNCPFCPPSGPFGSETLRVIAYRWRTVRVECDTCGARFSFDALQVANAMIAAPKQPQSDLAFLTHVVHEIAGSVVAGAMRANGATPEEIRALLAEHGIDDIEPRE